MQTGKAVWLVRRLLTLSLLLVTALTPAISTGAAERSTRTLVEPTAAGSSAPRPGTAGGSAASTAPASVPMVSINGTTVRPTQLDVITTRSGAWKFLDLGAVGDSRAYLMQLDRKPSFVRVMVCRRLFTKERGDTKDLNIQTVRVRVAAAGRPLDWTLGVAQGSCRVMQNEEPVAPRVEWLREAVAARVIPAYRRERAWIPGFFTPLAPDVRRGAYDPTSLGPIPGYPTRTPLSTGNYVGDTSAGPGEHPSSRGFLHDIDARLVDAALHFEDARILGVWPEFTQYTLYSLAQPQAAQWSVTNHVTADPQFPLAGDRPYEMPVWVNPNPAVDSAQDVTGWARDVAHMENTGFVHWLLTEDPIAGLLIQRQAAYVLGSFVENYRGGFGRTPARQSYGANFGQERAIFSSLSTLWKSRAVVARVRTTSGRLLWGSTRVNAQAEEAIAFYDEIVQRLGVAGESDPIGLAKRLSGQVLGFAGIEAYQLEDGTQVNFLQVSDFMYQQYGKEPLWLWTRGGNSIVKNWFASYTRGMVARVLDIGGAAAISRSSGTRGSGIPIAPTRRDPAGRVTPAMPPFTNERQWARWVRSLPLADDRGLRSDSFDGSSIHTVIQSESSLLYARDAGVTAPGLDSAIERVAASRRNTSPRGVLYLNLQMIKNLGGPN